MKKIGRKYKNALKFINNDTRNVKLNIIEFMFLIYNLNLIDIKFLKINHKNKKYA